MYIIKLQNDVAVLTKWVWQKIQKNYINTELDKYGYNKNKIKKQNFKKLNAEHKL